MVVSKWLILIGSEECNPLGRPAKRPPSKLELVILEAKADGSSVIHELA